MKAKKVLALVLALVMALSLAACSSGDDKGNQPQSGGQIGKGQEGEVEVNVTDEHLDAVEASSSGKWEAMFAPFEVEGRAMDMADFDLTPTAEELEAMKSEPIYGKQINYMLMDGCSSGTSLAEYLGYYKEAGLENVQGYKGDSYVDVLGTNQAQACIAHIATMLVPITNGVDIYFVGGAHLACKSLYVLGDSDYNTTEDLKGTSIAVPNGIGASDYNITSLMLDDDGINPHEDVKLVQVAASASVQAMENGEISAALLSDVYAYGMVKDGKLKCVSSMLDSDYSEVSICCAIEMNGTFVRENPVHAKKMYQAIQKALCYMRENPEEATDMMLEHELAAGDRNMNIMINNSQQFGLSDQFTHDNLKEIVNRYIRLGLLTATDDVDEVMELCWHPLSD